MVETTREAPENIGSAMKSIISRYGEMTTNPAKLVDSEGEAMSLNKVDKALASVGITLQDVNGQFRDFDEVILELSSKWDTIDKNTQRYIATVMAGNRQQSRFLALVGNYDRLSELYEEAANSQDAATLQTLKTMDSIETKINQLKVAFQEFYTNTGVEELIKGIIEYVTSLINTFNDMPKLFGKIPAAALMITARMIIIGKQLALKFISALEKEISRIGDIIAKKIK
jgi:TP901 family phage tail tape measure protein